MNNMLKKGQKNYTIDNLPSRGTIIKIYKKNTSPNGKMYLIKAKGLIVSGYDFEKLVEKVVKKLITRSFTIKTKQRKAYEKQCKNCGQTERLTTDHIIPKNFYEMFGKVSDAEKEDNWETLCVECNTEKNNRVDLTNENTFKKVIDYIIEQRNKKIKYEGATD